MFSTTVSLRSVLFIALFSVGLSSSVVWFFMRNEADSGMQSSLVSESPISNQNNTDKGSVDDLTGQIQDTRTFFKEVFQKKKNGICEVTEKGISSFEGYEGSVTKGGATVRLQFTDQKATYIKPFMSDAYIMTESGNYTYSGDPTCFFATPELKAIVIRAEKAMSYEEKRNGICREAEQSIFEIPADIQFTDACVGNPAQAANDRRQFEATIASSQATAVLVCDTGTITASGLVEPGKIEYAVAIQNCGVNGLGRFSISARSKIIENACATITEMGVTFRSC